MQPVPDGTYELTVAEAAVHKIYGSPGVRLKFSAMSVPDGDITRTFFWEAAEGSPEFGLVIHALLGDPAETEDDADLVVEMLVGQLIVADVACYRRSNTLVHEVMPVAPEGSLSA